MTLTKKQQDELLNRYAKQAKDVKPEEGSLGNLLPVGTHNVVITAVEGKEYKSGSESLELSLQSVADPSKGHKLSVFVIGKDGDPLIQSMGIFFNKLKMAFDPDSDIQNVDNLFEMISELKKEEEPITIKVELTQSQDGKKYLNAELDIYQK